MRLIQKVIHGVRHRFALMRFRRRLATLEQREHTFFMIVMSGGLHVAIAAIEHFPKKYPLIVIGNGFTEEENEWARKHFGDLSFLPIEYKQNHFRVLDALFSGWIYDFGIIDYDCFVLDPSLIDEIVMIDATSSMNGVYVSGRIPQTDQEIPETFVLYFNLAVLKHVMKIHGIGSKKYDWVDLASHLRTELNKIGISESRMPDNKRYFDTLRLLMVMALIDGFAPKFISKYIDTAPNPKKARIFHVGSISNPRQSGDLYSMRGSYFWRLSLERCNESGLSRIGYNIFGMQTLANLLEDYPGVEGKLGNDFLSYCNQIVETAFSD